MSKGFIPPHGDYRRLLSYQRAEVIYDATVRFCERHFDRRDRKVLDFMNFIVAILLVKTR